MSAGSFVTGICATLRAPFVANIKPGNRRPHPVGLRRRQRVWQVVQATCAKLGAETTVALFERRPADYYTHRRRVEAMISRTSTCCSRQPACCTRTRASPRWRPASVDLHGRRHDARMVPSPAPSPTT